MISYDVSPSNTRRPAVSRYATHPNAYTSKRASTASLFSSDSGAMYPGVPATTFAAVSSTSSGCRTSPKSRTFTKSRLSPTMHTNKLAGLMSR